MTTRREPRVIIGISVTAQAAEALRARGPRRDFDAIAERVQGTLVYQSRAGKRTGWSGRLLGEHVRQAWRIAWGTRRGDVLFADGEHLGLPLLLFVHLLFRRPARVVMLGHLPGRWWKRAAFSCLTRLGPGGVVLVHSVEQQRLLGSALGSRWSVEAIPYQVDTEFWTADQAEKGRYSLMRLVFAVGSEHRDYRTLARALDGISARVVIAAGSHWARSQATLDELPPNFEYLDEVLDFDALRDYYRRATLVVVPLHDVPNQSGVTTILEAMSLGLPVVVTASSGQRECITGPLVSADGTLDWVATAIRGSQLFGAPSLGINGLYVAPRDDGALRHAVSMLLGDPELRARMGANGAAEARQSFTLERFVERIAVHLQVPTTTQAPTIADRS